MSRAARQLVQDRAARDEAREQFDQKLALVRQDLDARGIGGRIADKIGDDARDVFEEAVNVADRNRGVIAGTIIAAVVWIFRNPIIAWIEGMLDRDD